MSALGSVALSLVVLVPGARAGAEEPSPGVRMTGFVREGGEPVAGAELIARPLGEPSDESGEPVETTSNEQGRYVLDDLRPGRWEVFILPPVHAGQDLGLRGFVRPGASDVVFSQMLEVGVPEVEDYEKDLVYPRTIAAGRVTADGEPVAALDVLVDRLDGEEWSAIFELVTDPEGRFRVRGLRSGRRYRMSAGGAFVSEGRMNRRRARAEVELAPGTVVDDLHLDLSSPGATLAGRILDEDGRPPARARVHLFADGAAEKTPPDGIVVQPDGTYRVVGLDPGPHLLVIAVVRQDDRPSSESGPFVAEDVVLEAGRSAWREDRLEPDRELTVEVQWTEESRDDDPPRLRLEGPDGLRLGGYFRIGFLGVSGRAGWRTGVTYPRQRVLRESYPVQPGSFVVVASKGGLVERRPVVVGDGDRRVEIDLRR